MRKLNNDICRCYGKGCEIKEKCLRHLTIQNDSKDNWYSFSYKLCQDNNNDFYIERKD